MGKANDTNKAENQLHPGAGLKCCGKTPYNSAEATCCKLGVQFKLKGNNHTFVQNQQEMGILVLLSNL